MAAAPPPAAAVAAPVPAAEAAPAQRFSLGAALVGGVPDATCGQPQQLVPPDWQALLVRKHADAAALWGLFRSCRGGRDLVLEHAPQAVLTLPLPLHQRHKQWVARQCQIKSALITRGRLPTRLHIDGWDERKDPQPSGTPLTMGRLQSLFNPATAANITEAVIRSTSLCSPSQILAVTQLLAALPSLTRLESACAQDSQPPAPRKLPQLRELSLSPIGSEAAWLSLRYLPRYMPQLTSLHYDGTCIPFYHQRQLFSASTHAAHLTTLSLPQWDLTDLLVGLILDHAPAVTQLSVQCVRLATAACRQREWGVAGITVKPNGHWGMHHMPVCKAGRVCWQVEEFVYFELEPVGEQGLNPDLLARLPHWQFDTTRLRVCPATDLPASDQPLALRNALTQLHTHLTTPTPIIELSDWWCITDEFISTVATALPAQSGLRLGMHMGLRLTDRDIRKLAQMGPRVCSAAAEKLCFEHAQWPWASLFLDHVRTLGLTELLSMPLPSDGGRRTLHVFLLTLAIDLPEEAIKLSRLLASVQWAPLYNRKIRIGMHPPCVLHPMQALLPQLTVLRNLRFVEGAEVTITLWGFTMGRDVMAALEGLPELAYGLEFRMCKWPLPASEYTRLAEHVPTSYTSWRVDCDQAVLDSICVGINEARARLGARPLIVYAHIDKVKRVGEHVVLKHAPGQ